MLRVKLLAQPCKGHRMCIPYGCTRVVLGNTFIYDAREVHQVHRLATCR